MTKLMVRTEKVTKVFRKGNQEIRPLQEADIKVAQGELLCLMGGALGCPGRLPCINFWQSALLHHDGHRAE